MQTTAAAGALIIHVTAGLVAILSGFAALVFAKGSRGHRNAGLTFYWGMLIMAAGAAYVGYARSELNDVVSAVTIAYLVITSRWALQDHPMRTKHRETGALFVAVAMVAANLGFAVRAASEGGVLYGQPAVAYSISAGIIGFAAVLDLIFVLRAEVPRKHRLARHLWRMCLALWIGTASFFLGQMKVFPEPLRNFYLLLLPVIVVPLAMFYWLVRVLLARKTGACLAENITPRSTLASRRETLAG